MELITSSLAIPIRIIPLGYLGLGRLPYARRKATCGLIHHSKSTKLRPARCSFPLQRDCESSCISRRTPRMRSTGVKTKSAIVLIKSNNSKTFDVPYVAVATNNIHTIQKY